MDKFAFQWKKRVATAERLGRRFLFLRPLALTDVQREEMEFYVKQLRDDGYEVREVMLDPDTTLQYRVMLGGR